MSKESLLSNGFRQSNSPVSAWYNESVWLPPKVNGRLSPVTSVKKGPFPRESAPAQAHSYSIDP